MQPSSSAQPRSSPSALTAVFRAARRDPELAVLEGLHALKHALRFGARVERIAITGPEEVRRLAQALAPDVLERIFADAQIVPPEAFADLAPQAPSTGVIAIARRPRIDVDALLSDQRPVPIVLLERPTDLGNLGACVRVAAAADIAGVLATGSHDPWDPAALRGGAGLHFALPVAHLSEDALLRLPVPHLGEDALLRLPVAHLREDTLPRPDGTQRDRAEGQRDCGGGVARPLVAIDPGGEELRPGRLPARAILAFGSERRGLSEELRRRADALVRLPMREGVSSLNLATSVAALLYAWRLALPG